MKSKYFIFLFCLLPFFGYGQGGFAPGFSLSVDYGLNRIETSGINGFFNTFNNFWGDSLSTPFDTLTGWELSHPNVGAGFRIVTQGKVGWTGYTGFTLGWRRRNSFSTWSNGVQNRLNMRIRDVQWNFATGVHIRNIVYIEGYLAAYIRGMKFGYTTIYQDGSESMSSEYKLNGLYTGTTTAFDGGFQIGARIKSIMPFVRVTWPIPNFPPAKGLVSLDDYDNVNFPPSDFPANYTTWATDPIGFVERDEGLKTDDFEGMRITFGVELILGAKGYSKEK